MADQYLGIVQLGLTLSSSHLTVIPRNLANGGTPKFADAAPTFRIYGPTGLLTNATGSLTKMDPSAAGGAITAATNATPIQITAAAHGLTTGTRVTIENVGGNTAANGDWQITQVDANNFTLNNSVGNGAYTNGGIWHTTGLYLISYTVLGSNGFASGTNYVMLVTWIMSSVTQAAIYTFTVN